MNNQNQIDIRDGNSVVRQTLQIDMNNKLQFLMLDIHYFVHMDLVSTDLIQLALRKNIIIVL